MQKWVIIIGSTSGIAKALVHHYAPHHPLILAARDKQELQTQAQDLRIRHDATIHTIQYDALTSGLVNQENDIQFWQQCLKITKEELYGLILCHGIMPSQKEMQQDFALLRQMIELNYLSQISLLELAAKYFSALPATGKRRGFMAALGSVAGERGRAGNYLYGSAKGALHVYMQGLRQRMFGLGVSVTTLKPGPIDTAMTFGLEKLPLLISPQHAAKDIYRAIRRGKDVAYTPLPWGIIFPIAKCIPEALWKRLDV